MARWGVIPVCVGVHQHVVDSSSGNREEQRQAVVGVLVGLGLHPPDLASIMIEAWNKVRGSHLDSM